MVQNDLRYVRANVFYTRNEVMMRIFILEDDRQRILLFREASAELDVTYAESCAEAQERYHPPYDVMFLDHDLGGQIFVNSDDDNTGSAFSRWLPADDAKYHPTIIIHSYNPDGTEYMRQTLVDKGYTAHKIPFGTVVLNILKDLSTRAQL